MSKIFGGSKSKSWNQAYEPIKAATTPALGYIQEGGQGMSSLLKGDTAGLDAFKKAMGYDWEAQQGTNDLFAQRAQIGGLDSGASLKSLAKYQTGLNNQYGNTYLSNLLNLSNVGTNAASILTSAGQMSKSSQSPGLVGAMQAAAKTAASASAGGV